MSDFAKLYRAEDIGQVLVMLDSGDEGPEIGFHFKPAGLGVCAVKLGFPDTEDGWKLAEQALEKVTEEFALETVRKTMESSPISAMHAALRDDE